MPRIRTVLTRTFPEASTTFKMLRSRWERLRRGDGDVRVFDRIMAENYWRDPESRSGTGSNVRQTETLRRELPQLLARLGVRSLLDAPCGDFNWMRMVDLGGISYTGVDVVAPLIAKSQQSFGGPGRRFITGNIIVDPLPHADAILSRDALSHLSYKHILSTLQNFRSSGATYLLLTTYPSRKRNWDIVTGDWRPLNFEIAPFGFPAPLAAITEGSTEFDGDFSDKTLAIWGLASLPIAGRPS